MRMISVKQTIRLYDVLNKYFQNAEDSQIFVSEIGEMMDSKLEFKINSLATKNDLVEIKQEIADLRNATKQDLAEVRTELKQDIAVLRSDFARLDAGINLNITNSALSLERTQKEQLKWIIGIMITMTGLIIALMKIL
jgi:hypothetical protein